MIELTGHYAIKKRISDSVNNSTVGHAYIFDGIDGIGKTTAAKWFAAAALCKDGCGAPCGVCDSCRKIEAGTHPDVSVITEDFVNLPEMRACLHGQFSGKTISANSVHAMRIARYIASTKPFAAERKFVIIPDAEQLNVNAQNALLKVFEEPPEYMTIVLISNNSGFLLSTILSRAVMYRFQPLSDSETEECVKRNCGGDVTEFVRLGFGSPGTALEMAENPELIEESKRIRKVFFDYTESDGDMTAVLPLISKDNIYFVLNCIAHEALTLSKIDFENAVRYVNIFYIIQDIRFRLKGNCNFTLTVTDMLIRCWEELHG